MKNSPLVMAMLAAVCLLTFATLILAILYEKNFRQLRVLQPQRIQIENTRNVIGALANDSIEYSKHNPAIDPILQQMGFKPRPAGAAPAAAAKPSGK
jgi:hypothetical protein